MLPHSLATAAEAIAKRSSSWGETAAGIACPVKENPFITTMRKPASSERQQVLWETGLEAENLYLIGPLI